MMGGVPVAQITLVSPRTEPDTYVLGLSSGPQDGGLATVLAALVPLYDQVVHAMLPLAWGTLDI